MDPKELEKELDKEVGRFVESLTKEDPLGVVIRGHLFIESKLIRLIEEALPDPGAIDLTRLNFPLKLDLAVALKLLPETEKRGYAQLNALRNQLAHNVDAQLLQSDERRLYLALSQEQRKIADSLPFRENPAFALLRASIASLGSQSLDRLFPMVTHQDKSEPSE